MIAAKVTHHPSATQPAYDAGKPHQNPHGISQSTITQIFKWARPGMLTYREWFCSRVSDIGEQGGRYFTAARTLNAILDVSYDEANAAAKLRAMDGGHLLDILVQPFKSYQEMLRSLMVQVSQPSIYRLLKDRKFILSMGDFPKVYLQWVLTSQGWGSKEAPARGPRHLGAPAKAACLPCHEGNAGSRIDL